MFQILMNLAILLIFMYIIHSSLGPIGVITVFGVALVVIAYISNIKNLNEEIENKKE